MVIVNDKYLENYRKRLRYVSTKSEVILWKYIKNRRLGYKFRRQVSISTYIVDFYCSELKLAIEIDGESHQSSSVYKKDLIKESNLYNLGIKILRIPDQEVFLRLDTVLRTIVSTCDGL